MPFGCWSYIWGRYGPNENEERQGTPRAIATGRAELDSATGRNALNAAARKLMQLKAELRRLEQPTRPASGEAASAASA